MCALHCQGAAQKGAPMKTAQGFYGLSAMKPEKLCRASGLHSPQNKLVTRLLLLLLLAGISGLTAGCALLRIGGGGAGKASAQPHLVQEQIELQRFADDFFARGGQGIDESAERLGTDAGRQQVAQIKLSLGSSVLSIVSGPNPNTNLLDLVSITVLTRLSVQDYWMHTTNGAAFQPWLDASRVLETNVWNLGGPVPPAGRASRTPRGNQGMVCADSRSSHRVFCPTGYLRQHGADHAGKRGPRDERLQPDQSGPHRGAGSGRPRSH